MSATRDDGTGDPFPPRETARLLLRCVEAADAGRISVLMTPEISRWLAAWPVPFTPEMALERIGTCRARAFAGDALPFAVVEKATHALIGWVMVARRAGNRNCAALGYWLGESYQGRGFMRELAPVVLAAGFGLAGVRVIEAGAQPENAGSFATMRHFGMQPAGERMEFAPARGRAELCRFYDIARPIHMPG